VALVLAGGAVSGCGREDASPVATLPAAPGVVLEVAPAAAAPGARVTVTTAGGADDDVKGTLASLRRNDVTVAWLIDERFGGPALASPGRTVAAPAISSRLSQPQVFVLPARLEPGAYRLCTGVGPPGPVRREACGDLTVIG
jgi:hypothetical protein